MASSLYSIGAAGSNLIMPTLGGLIYDLFGGNVIPESNQH